MWNIKQQILIASNELNIELSILSKEEVENIKQDIMNKYLKKNALRKFPLFEKLDNYVGIDIKDSWIWIADFLKKNQAILFFNPEDEKEYYKLKNGEDIVLIINEIFNVEFYVTNSATEYLLGYNHSQCLVAAGLASFWLEDQKAYKKRYNI